MLQEKDSLLVNAQSDLEKRVLAQKLNRLDQKYNLLNSDFVKIIDTANAIGGRLYANSGVYDKIKRRDAASHEAWSQSRAAIAEQFNNAKSNDLKAFYSQKLNLVDDTFKLKFMGFLLSNSPE